MTNKVLTAALIVLTVVVGFLFVDYTSDKMIASSNFVNCEKVGLCKTVTLARLAKETGVNIDGDGNISVPPKVHTTITQAPTHTTITQAPPAVVNSDIAYTGNSCHRKEDAPGVFSGREGYGPGGKIGCWKF